VRIYPLVNSVLNFKTRWLIKGEFISYSAYARLKIYYCNIEITFMQELLRDPMWQSVAAFLALVAILTSILLYFKQRQIKSLSYEIISLTPLLSIEEEIKGDLQVLYHGNPVDQVHLIVIEIKNSGNTPIRKEDFERPVNFNFGEETEIFTAEITDTNPNDLEAFVNIEDGRVVLTPIMLNEEDTITVKMLISKFDEINVDGRIIGVKKIEEHEESSSIYFITSIIGMIMSFVGMYIMTKPEVTLEYIGFFIFIIGYLTLAFALIKFLPERIRKRMLNRLRSLLLK